MFFSRARSPSDLIARPPSPATVGGPECQHRGRNWCSTCRETHCNECARYHSQPSPLETPATSRESENVAKMPKCCKNFVEGTTLFCKRCKRSYCAFCAIKDHSKCGGSSVLIPSASDIQKLKNNHCCDRNFSKAVSDFRVNHTSVNKRLDAMSGWMELADKPGEVTLFSLSQKRETGKPERLPVPRCRMDPLAKMETSQESTKSWINSMAMLSDGTLLFIQSFRSELKHVTPTGVILSACSFYTNPWAVTCINDNMAAVTLPERRHIQLVRIKSRSLLPGRRIVTKHKCRGICSTGAHLLATCCQGCIHVLSLQGDEFLAVSRDVQGQRLFPIPGCIVSSPDKKVVYVTDLKKHTLTALKVEGHRINRTPLFVFSDPHLKGPKGLALDEAGFIYMVGMISKTIFKLTPEGRKVQMFRRKQGEDLYENICVSRSGCLVYVSVFEGDVLIFSLTSNQLCQACEIFKRIN